MRWQVVWPGRLTTITTSSSIAAAAADGIAFICEADNHKNNATH